MWDTVSFEKQFSHIDRCLKKNPTDEFWLNEKKIWIKRYEEFRKNK